MRKTISILLSIVLIATSFTALFTLEAGAVATNLLTNGDLSNVSNFAVNGKSFSMSGFNGNYSGVTANSSVEMVQDPTLPTAAKTGNNNAVKFTFDSNGTTGNATIYSTNTYTLKASTDYEMVYWVKTSELYGLKFYIYEPTYTSRLNTTLTSPGPAEGQNIYANTWTAGPDAANPPYWQQRVVRTDISNIVRANNGYLENLTTGVVNGTTAYTRNAPQADKDSGLADSRGYYDITKKYAPSGLNNGWVKVSMSFKTKAGTWDGSTATCTANSIVYTGNGLSNIPYSVPITLGISTTDQTNRLSTLSVAGLQIHETYTTVNAAVDSSYLGGTISLNGGTSGVSATGQLYTGDTATLTATPLAGNTFLGWYSNTEALGGTLLSSNSNYTFTPSVNTSVYARFQNNNLYLHPGFEDYAVNYVLASGGALSTAGDEISVDGWYTGVSNWFKISAVSNAADPVYSGSRSLRIDHRYNDGAYYQFNVTANTNYTVKFKWYLPKDLSLGGTATYTTRYLKITNTSGTLLSTTDNKYVKGTGAWQDCVLTFNSGANTTVRFAMGADHASATGADQLHLDDLGIYKTATISATRNNYGGTATSSITTGAPGDSVTFTATPVAGSTFTGWYKAGVLYSTQAVLTEMITGDTSYEARFTGKAYTGFEEYATNTNLATGGTSSTTPVAYSYEGWHCGSSTWMFAKTVTTPVNAGTKSLSIFNRNNTGLYYEFPVQANTAYYINFKWLIQAVWNSTSNTRIRNFTIGTTGISDANDSSANALVKSGQLLANNQWNDQTMVFNSGNNTTLRFIIDYYSDLMDNPNAYLFLDDLTIDKAPVVTATRSGSGGYVSTPSVGVAPGGSATLTAVPNEGDTFLGWYLAETLVSNSTTFTTPAINADTQYVAKFTNNTVYTNGSFENYANNTRIDNYTPPEVTTAPAASWHGTSPWYQNTQRYPSSNYSWISASVTNTQAHSGTNSLALSGMYQGFYTEITNIMPNTSYTLSFYYKLPVWDATNVPSLGHVSIVPGTSQVDYSGNPSNFPTLPNQADRSFFSTYNAADTANDLWQQAIVYQNPATKGTGNWEQQTITFNSGSNASVFLSLNYAALASSGIKMYVDDITMAPAVESLINIDADTNSGKLTGGTGTAVTTEVATTASDPAVLGSKVYSVTTATDFTAAYSSDTMVLKKDKQYDVSFYFKVADGHKMLTTTDNNLQFVSFFMSAAQNTTNIPIKSAYTITREPVGGTKVTGTSQTTEFNINKAAVVDGQGATMWQKITASFIPTNDSIATFALRPNALGTVYIDQIKVTCAENATASVQAALTEVGSAIRTNGVQALRFKTSIDKSVLASPLYDTYEIIEYGSVAIKSSYLNGKELTIGSYTQADGTTIKNSSKGAAYSKGLPSKIFAETETAYQFTAALTGISQANYNTSYSVRAYVVLARPDGSTFTIYDDSTRSATIYAIANAAYNAPGSNDGFAELPAVRNYLDANIISKADFTTYPGDGFKPIG